MKNTAMLAVSLLTGVTLHGETRTNAVQVSAGDDLPGSVVQSWLANSFSRHQGHHSVPVTAIGIAVTPDGMINPVPLGVADLWLEANQSATSAQRVAVLILDAFDHPSESCQVVMGA